MKVLKGLLLLLLILVIGIVSGVFIYLKYILPPKSTVVHSPSIREGATAIFDRYGVPHIYAEKIPDLYFALGYIHARDRLFQMDFYRRAAEGKLSEVFGKDLLDADLYLRTLGFHRTAKVQIENLPPELLEMVEAYSDGVNAWIAENPLPIEFIILGYKPDQWMPEDSQAMGNLISFQLASWAYQNELLNYLLIQKLGEERAKTFLPQIPEEAISVIAFLGETKSAPGVMSNSSRRFLDRFIFTSWASNNWVISGKRTETGKPILAEDSHESGPELPTQWHVSHLVGKEFDCAGAMFPGAPIFIFGHNRSIAWGVTNFTLDNQDIYLEKMNPENPNEVMYNGKWVAMETVIEKIHYKDEGGMGEKTLAIHLTPHGPIINDIEPDIGSSPASLRHVGAEPWPILEGFYRLNTAQNWDEFLSALSIYAAGPQHFVYADIEGNIGYVGAGKCPERKGGGGEVPSPGWDGSHEWTGYYPFEMTPKLLNPERGYIGTANNPPALGDSTIPLGNYYEAPWRAIRIEELLTEKEKLSVSDVMKMHLDVHSPLAERIVPIILATMDGNVDDEIAPALSLLSGWDFSCDRGSGGAAVFNIFFNRILENTFRDEMGEELFVRFMNDKAIAENTMYRLIAKEDGSPFFDDVTTQDKVEDFTDISEKSLRETVKYLEGECGGNPERWAWGKVHKIEFSHVFGEISFLRPFFNYGPFPFGGSDQTLNRGGFNKNKPYKVDITASIRYIVDFSDFDNSLIVLSSGESGNLLSRHRTDMAALFLNGDYIPWYLTRDKIEAYSEGEVTFLKK